MRVSNRWGCCSADPSLPEIHKQMAISDNLALWMGGARRYIPDMKLRLTRATTLVIVLNEIRGFVMIAPALLAVLRAHHLF